MIGYKKVANGKIVELAVYGHIVRIAGCSELRTNKVYVCNGSGVSKFDNKFKYIQGTFVEEPALCKDPNTRFGPGIHFFAAREEAEAYDLAKVEDFL